MESGSSRWLPAAESADADALVSSAAVAEPKLEVGDNDITSEAKIVNVSTGVLHPAGA